VPRVERKAAVGWDGNLARGSGILSAASSGAFELPFTIASRVSNPEGKTSPEELLAAAHGGCFATSLAGELTKAGTPPERLDVRVTVVLDEAEGGHRIVASQVDANGRVPGIAAAAFDRAVRTADEGCTFSALIRASGEVVVSARLDGSG
jgi:osmotically inducible protein OsmC